MASRAAARTTGQSTGSVRIIWESDMDQVSHSCFTYGLPSAAGALTRPTSPATAKIVARYGAVARSCDGIGVPSPDIEIVSAPAKPNSPAAAIAPNGDQRPKMTAARAMKPLPLVIDSVKAPMLPTSHAPP